MPVEPMVILLVEDDDGHAYLVEQNLAEAGFANPLVRLRDGLTLDPALESRIRARVRANASPRHVPAKIVQVSAVPRTRSGKIVELAVRDVVLSPMPLAIGVAGRVELHPDAASVEGQVGGHGVEQRLLAVTVQS